MNASNLTMWTAIAAFAMPLVVALFQQPRWRPRTRALVAAASSIVVGAGTVYFTTPTLFDDPSTLTTTILAVLVGSTAAYRAFWKPMGIRSLEDATSPKDDTMAVEAAELAELQAMHGVDVNLLHDHTEPPRA